MPNPAPSQLPVAPARTRTAYEEPGYLAQLWNRLRDAVTSMSIMDFTMRGSPAWPEHFTTYTVASGVITLTITGRGGQDTAAPGSIVVDTEGSAASDDLDTINGGREGQVLFLRASSYARTVVLKDGTGNLALGTDISLDKNTKFAILKYSSTLSKWLGLDGTGMGSGMWAPLTNGDPVTPEILFDSNGDVIMTFIP